ncbi:unnamed protein product [Rotaria sp. Silwood1]|nr:unnamed protein product [Rotaria sp. Silwood1]CAF1629833.1 unnamed protein product [Rotaria sp. Silwood1]CAF3894188.1 unnamed protein product [Rotaria sp. Silwood1]
MNEIEIGLEYAKNKKKARLHKNNISRRKLRTKCNSILHPNDSIDIETSVITNLGLMTISSDENNMNQPDVRSHSTSVNILSDQIEENIDESSIGFDNLDFNDLMHHQEAENSNLHEYTSMDCLSFSKHLIEFIRNANVSKTHAEQLITLIQSGLPQPNTLPNNYSDLLKLLSGNIINFFSFIEY